MAARIQSAFAGSFILRSAKQYLIAGADGSAMKMLIMRGKAGMYALPGEKERNWPRGALDESAALEFARLRGYSPTVLDVAGYSAAGSRQMQMAMREIRADDEVFALYGFPRAVTPSLTSSGR